MIGSSLVPAVSCLTPAIFAIVAAFLKPSHRQSSILFVLVGLLLAAAAVVSWNSTIQWQAPEWVAIGFVPVVLRIDLLSSFFLLLLGLICTCCAIFSPCYLEHLKDKISTRIYWMSLFAFVAGMVGVIVAANAVVFLVAWEVMALSSAVLVVSEYKKHKAQRASFIYLVATRLATVFLAAGFLLMYAKFNDWSFVSWQFADRSTYLAAAFILIGLVIKAGIWPFHIWLPHAHPEAPSPVSALMSGVMVKVAIYAAIRFFILGNLTSQLLAYSLFALACISAFWGVLFAVNQRELKRLLAYSTVENVGLIFIGLSLCIWAKNLGLQQVAEVALLAALLQSFAHALFKSLLFLCAGSVDYATHSRDFAVLGGLNRNMPITGATFILGSAAICALPPLNGFASKWCLYQALLQSSFSMPTLVDRIVSIAAIGVLSAVGALAIATYAKAIGVAFLGKPRSALAKNAKEVPKSMITSQVVLSLACIGTGVMAAWSLGYLRPFTMLATGNEQSTVTFAQIPLWQLAFALVLLLCLIYAVILRRSPDTYTTWDCGFGAGPTKNQVTAESFAQPIARIFTPVLQYNLSVDITGRDRRHFPERIVVQPSMVSLLETRIYKPAASALVRLSQTVAKLQAGSIHLYLMYVCIALVVLVVAGTQLW